MLTIKEWAEEDRPREKLLLKGATVLSDAELLAILIGSGNAEESAVQVAQHILRAANHNLYDLGKMTIAQLTTNFKGIGEAKAVTIAAAMELARRRARSEAPERESIGNSRDAYSIFYALLCDLPHEELWVATLNRNNKVINKVKISQGGISQTVVDVRLILRAGIDSFASGLVLCHNHPSGNLRPSREDDRLTERVKETAKLMEMTLLDHIILSNAGYYSYADEGKL